MTVTNESGGRLNAFANEPNIEIIDVKTSKFKQSQLLVLISALASISIIGIYFYIR